MPVITVHKFESRETLQNEYDSGVTEKENILFYCTGTSGLVTIHEYWMSDYSINDIMS